MWPFKNKEIYRIEGRKIIIEDESKLDDLDYFKKAIISACKISKISKKFPKIIFRIQKKDENDPGNSKGRIGIEESFKKTIIYLFPENFYRAGKNRRLVSELSQTITHELTHIWHNQLSKTLRRYAQSCRRMIKSIDRKIISDRMEDLKGIRIFMMHFINKLSIEGLAVYCAQGLNNLVFNDPTSKIIYREARVAAKEIRKRFENLLINQQLGSASSKNSTRFNIDLIHDSYQIGYQMIYAVRFIDPDTTVEDIAKLSPFKFIKKYEAVMKIKGLQPVISLTSGDGILDYKDIVAKWWATIKIKEKQLKSAA